MPTLHERKTEAQENVVSLLMTFLELSDMTAEELCAALARRLCKYMILGDIDAWNDQLSVTVKDLLERRDPK